MRKFIAGFIVLLAICFFCRTAYSYDNFIEHGVYWRADASDDKEWISEILVSGTLSSGVLTMFQDASADITLYNDTTGDADYGRQTQIRFDGRQSGAERSRMSIIEVAHDGTADDQKGIMTISVNDGNDNNDPTDVMTINSSGRVGIGETTPDTALHVSKGSVSASSHSGAVATIEDDGSYVSLQILSLNSAEQQIRFGDPQDDGAGILVYNHSVDKFQYCVGGPIRLTLNNSGNLGINDVSPDGTLDITGTAAATVTLDIDACAAQSANIVDIDDSSGNALFTLDSTGDVVLRTINFGADAESDDDYSADISGISQYVTGMVLYFSANTANTGACTINISGLGAKSLKMLHDQDPDNNYIESGSIVHCVYDGTNFQLLSPDANP